MRRLVFAVLGLALLSASALQLSCRPVQPTTAEAESVSGPSWFEDITAKVGLDFVHDAGPTGTYFMPQQVGSGAALFDFNKDGKLDVYLLQNGGSKSGATNRLYQQKSDGTFQDVSKGSGLDIAGHNMGVAIGDFDNDGWPDVLVTQYLGAKLFRNNGNGTFTDVTEKSGLSNPGWGTSAAFFDYDRDGWLDVVIVNYVDYDPTWPCKGQYGQPDYCAPKTFHGRVSRLFHNRGGEGCWKGWEDVTEASGLGRIPGPGLGVVCADLSGDGWPDIFIANDGQPNRLWVNQKNGTFKEESVVRGVAYNAMGQAQAGMGIGIGDVDGDGLLDLFVTHLTEETHTLWRQGPPGLFQDQTAQAGFSNPAWRSTGFGTLLADFDLDGALDAAVVNGRVSALANVEDSSLGPFWSAYGEYNQLFRGDGKGRFQNISRSNKAFCGRPTVSRGLARGDIDGDGAPDLLVTAIAGPARLFRNIIPKGGHWLAVRAFDPSLHRDVLGALVRVRGGGRMWVCSLHPSESYLCSSEPVAHFGLGEVGRVDEVEITWPDGRREVFDQGYAADQRLELRKGGGNPARK